ncbi:MAG: hypothetical protein J6Z03_00570 [Erysipelotrichaceae bacterium]|nr:hypothetical protein [Erysipelotrichaceae bacterium]
MEDNRAYESLRELMYDLDRKIDELNMFASSADERVAEKVTIIRNNAVKVLNNVKEKTIALSKEVNDESELLTIIASIKERADSLSDEAMEKINALMIPVSGLVNGETKDDIVELIDDENEGYPDFAKAVNVEPIPVAEATKEMPVEDVTPVEVTPQKAVTERSEVSKKALEVLKGWLTPDMVQK